MFGTREVAVIDYDPAWPERFATIAGRVRDALGELALGIEHVGSTAVPGLPAKDVIDVDVVLRDAGNLSAVIERLATIGYTYLGDLGVEGREAFAAPDDAPPQHLYVCAANAEELRRHLAFRDALRADAALAQQYAVLKRELAGCHRFDVDAYAEGKSPFVNAVLREKREIGDRRRSTMRG